MRTIQFSVGEAIEAMYDELMETYGDKELALAGAQAVGDELVARFARQPRKATTRRAALVPALAPAARLRG
jgi:hypothetical protein